MTHNRLYRWDCPTVQQLADFYMEILDGADVPTIERHLEKCVHCRAEMQAMTAFMKGGENVAISTAEKPSQTEKPNWLGELVAFLAAPSPSFAMRGTDKGPIVASAEDGTTLFLELQKKRSGNWLTGQLTAEEQERWAEAMLIVHQGGMVQGITRLDDLGLFTCQLQDDRPVELRITTRDGRSLVLKEISLIQ